MRCPGESQLTPVFPCAFAHQLESGTLPPHFSFFLSFFLSSFIFSIFFFFILFLFCFPSFFPFSPSSSFLVLQKQTWDGQMEVMIGTFGRRILVYRLVPGRPAEIIWNRLQAHAVFWLEHVDCTGDGLRELVVLTAHGVHVLQVVHAICFFVLFPV